MREDGGILVKQENTDSIFTLPNDDESGTGERQGLQIVPRNRFNAAVTAQV